MAGMSGKAYWEVTFEPKVNYCGGDWVQNIVDGGRGQLSAKEAGSYAVRGLDEQCELTSSRHVAVRGLDEQSRVCLIMVWDCEGIG